MHDRLRAVQDFVATDPQLDALALRLRRLTRQRGYDRMQVGSPLLKRLLGMYKQSDNPKDELTELRTRLRAQALNGQMVAYLMQAIELETDEVRLRLS